MPDYKIETMDKPEKYSKVNKKTLKDHRSFIKHWEFFELRTYGDHKWNFYKLYTLHSDKIEEEFMIYFTDYKKYKKIINDKFKEEFDNYLWIPIDNIYISGAHGVVSLIETDFNIKLLDFSEKESVKYFNKNNVIKKETFLRWVMLIATYESIETAKDLSDNFFSLAEKFKVFCNIDMTPAMVVEYFNKKLSEIKEHNIEPIVYVIIEDFYNFVTNPIVSSIGVKSAIDKLFYLVERSDFLKGLGSGANWRPSFKNFISKLDKIFNCGYHLKDLDKIKNNINNYRKLKSNELIIYDEKGNSTILTDVKIPKKIIEKYSLIDIDKPAEEKVTPEEIKKYEEIFNKSKLNNLDDIKSKYGL